MSQITPLIAIHLTAALGAVATGPVALWARKGATQRPRLHRAFGYAWVTLMTIAAVSALFIPAVVAPLFAGMGPIHALSFMTLGALGLSFWFLAKGNIAGHRKTMQNLYIGACGVAGAFTLLPGRFLGNLVWGQWLGLISPNHVPAQGKPMLAQIALNTPLWVWGLLAALVVLGLTQMRDRSAGLPRTVAMPLAMGSFSLWGLVNGFGTSPAVLGAWLAAAALAVTALLLRPLPAGVRYDAGRREFALPGSWVPLVLILGIFSIKYATSVTLAMHPALRAEPSFALAIATLSGLFSGIFAGRTLRLLRLAVRPAAPRAATLAPANA
jgi:uncharacterized membrane protein